MRALTILFLMAVAVIYLTGCEDVARYQYLEDEAVSRHSAQARADEAAAQIQIAQAQAQAEVQTAQINADLTRTQSTQDYALATQAQAMYREAGNSLLAIVLVVALIVVVALVLFYQRRDRRQPTQILILSGPAADDMIRNVLPRSTQWPQSIKRNDEAFLEGVFRQLEDKR